MTPKLLLASAALATALSAQAGVSVTGSSLTYTQNFDSLVSTGTQTFVNDSTLSGWSLFRSAGSALTVTAGTGSSNTGGFYSFGATGSSDRALGSVASGSTGTITYALALTNDTGADLSGFVLSFAGEQWRNGGTATVQSLAVQYGFGDAYTAAATALTSFDSVVGSTTAGIVDGNVAGRVTGLGGTVNTNWGAGQTLWITWTDVDNTGGDHGLAIDDISVSAISAVPEPGTYAMLLAGLGAMGFIARRRRD